MMEVQMTVERARLIKELGGPRVILDISVK